MRHPIRLAALVTTLAIVAASCGGERRHPSDTVAATVPAPAGPAPTGPAATGPGGTLGAPDTLPALPSTTAPPTPAVSLPASPVTALHVTDLAPGTGPAAADGSTVVLHYVGVVSKSGQQFDNSYERGEPFTVVLGAGGVIEGWEQGLQGARAGMRRQIDIPNALAYGASSRGDVIKSGDDLSFVVDILAVVPPTDQSTAPTVTAGSVANVAEVSSTDLVVGTGAEWTLGQTGFVQLLAINAADGAVLQSTWDKAPSEFRLGELLPALNTHLAGMKVGGRRKLQIPFAEAFGAAGNPNLGLPANTDLILIVDLLGTY